MRLAKALLLTLVLLSLAACGYVEGNYPVPKTQAPALPETYENQGQAAPLVWDRAPELRGFFTNWVDLQAVANMTRMGAEAGDPTATRELEFVEDLAKQDVAAFGLAVFMERGAQRRLGKGRLNIEFSDGTSTRDVGVVFYERQRKPPRRHTTLDSGQTLEAKFAAEPGKPVGVWVLVPKEFAGKTVTLMRLF